MKICLLRKFLGKLDESLIKRSFKFKNHREVDTYELK